LLPPKAAVDVERAEVAVEMVFPLAGVAGK
jgi:hypothetical protein